MQSTFKNLLYVLRHYKLATVTNLFLGLSFAFLLFMLISIHVGHELSFDASLEQGKDFFQLETSIDLGYEVDKMSTTRAFHRRCLLYTAITNNSNASDISQ